MKIAQAKESERKTMMARYDIQCKKVLSNSHILAWMMEEMMEEYSNLSRDFIRRCIEKNIHMDREQNIRFSTYVPKNMGKMNLMVHTFLIKGEQDESAFVMQGLKDRYKFEEDDDELMEPTIFGISNKMYSVWIGVSSEKKCRNCMSIYDIRKQHAICDTSDNLGEDEISVAMMYFYPNDEKKKPFYKMLNTIMSPTLPMAHKKHSLWNDYQIPMEKEFVKELKLMCQLSQWVYECGVKDVVEKLLQQNILSDTQILQVSKISKEELDYIKDELRKTA